MVLPLSSAKGVRSSVMEQQTTCYNAPGYLEEISSASTTRERFRVKVSIYPTKIRLQKK